MQPGMSVSYWPGERVSLLSVVRDIETGGDLIQERVWRILDNVMQLACGEATDGFGLFCV